MSQGVSLVQEATGDGTYAHGMRLILLVAALARAAPRAAGYSPARDCSAPEYRRLDFWLGTWEVKDPAGAPQGDNLIVPIDGGCALRESWTATDGSTTITWAKVGLQS